MASVKSKAKAKRKVAPKPGTRKIGGKKKAGQKASAKRQTGKKTTAKRVPAKKKTVGKKKSAAKKKAVGKKKSVAKKKAVGKKKTVAKKKVAAKKKAPAAKRTAADSRPRKTATARKQPAAKAPAARRRATAARPTGKKPAAARRTPSRGTHQLSLPALADGSVSVVRFTPYKERRGEEYMNDRQIEHFRNILLDWRKQLMEEVDRTLHHMQDEAANFPDPNDRATQESEFTLELRTRDRERKLIRKIHEAMATLDTGDYGFCEACGVDIGIRRLEARPTATLCIDCKELDEIRERQMG